MILPVLREPSLGVVRARLIAGRLAAPGSAESVLPHVVATGKTGSGKSTLGNLMLGAADVLRATGYIDCTDAIYRISFPQGLVYVDLPGVASDDLLENYNRIAFGLAQRSDWTQVSEVRVLDYQAGQQSLPKAAERSFPAAGLPSGTVTPDVILYLIAPHKQMVRDEESYLRDLLHQCGGERFVYVLNIHHGRSGARVATAADIADARERIADCCRAVGNGFDERTVVEMDCRTGTGLAELLTAMQLVLGTEQALPLAEVISYQAEHSPSVFRGEVQECVAGYASGLAGLVPESGEDAATAIGDAARSLTNYAGRLSGQTVTIPLTERRRFEALTSQVAVELRHELTEPILVTKKKDVYRTVPVRETYTETDYDRPIYEWETVLEEVDPVGFDGVIRGVVNMFAEGRFTDYRTARRRTVAGYETRQVQKIVGHREEYVRTDTYQVQEGTRVVSVSYRPLAYSATALALTAWYLALRRVAGAPKVGADSVYQGLLGAVRAASEVSAGVLPADADSLLEQVIAKGIAVGSSE